MTGFATLAMVSLDCAEPPTLAEFYAEVLGWKVSHSEDAYAMITDGSTTIGFGKMDGYEPPVWAEEPAEHPKRYHLDLYVEDVADAEQRCVKLGATKPEFQPGDDRWQVMLDPGGHPFCLCPKQ